MPGERLEIGDVVRLTDSESRRTFLKRLGVAGAGVAGLTSALGRAAGAEPEGVPLVRTVSGRGNPSSFVVVHEDEHDAIRRFDTIDPAEKFTDSVHSVRLADRSDEPGDVRIVAEVEGRPNAARRRNPKRLNGLPVSYEQAPAIEPKTGSEAPSLTAATNSDSEDNCRVDDPSSNDTPELKAGDPVNGSFDNPPGTIGLIAENEEQEGVNRMLVTARHVVSRGDFDQNSEISEQLYYDDSNEDISTCNMDHVIDIPEQDVVAYRFNGNGDPYTQNIRGDLGPIVDVWEYRGLYKNVGNDVDQDPNGDGSTLSAEFYGQTTGRGSAEVARVKKSKSMNGGSYEYVAGTRSDQTNTGDSGCPFVTDVDGDAKLVGLLHGDDGTHDWLMVPSAPKYGDDGWFDEMPLRLW